MSDELFNVLWWDRDGGQHRELQYVPAEQAVKACRRLTHGPASLLGIVAKVMITDSGDCCNFLWTKENGIEFPKKGETDAGSTDAD